MSYLDALHQVVEAVGRHIRTQAPGDPVGLYLFGSAASGGVRPDSDIDLLLLTTVSLSPSERADLVRLLLPLSGWKGHRLGYPEAAGRRPVELTSITIGTHRPARVTTLRDFQYGEWLRAALVSGELPQPTDDPDTLPLVATALTANRAVFGPPLETVLAPVDPQELNRALRALVPSVIAGLDGDERNGLLTLARMIVTCEDGVIVPKDVAVDRIVTTLQPGDRRLLELARDGYRGTVHDHWDRGTQDIAGVAGRLAARIVGDGQ